MDLVEELDDVIDLQWFADDDDDDWGDFQSFVDDPSTAVTGTNDLAEGEEGKSGWNEDGTYTDYEGNTITPGEGYVDTEGNWNDYTDDEKSTDEYGWEFKDPNSVGYEGHVDKKGEWHDDILSVHNLGKRAEDLGHKAAGWIETKADEFNRALGGSRAGYTSADFERQQEAEKAWNTYNQKAEQAQQAVDNFKSREGFDPNNPNDQKTLAELEAEVRDLESRRDSISRDIQSTDTGSRLGNMGNNLLEDLGDVGTRVNQFFGGSDRFGLSAHGDISDRNGDGHTSITERLANMGRETINYLGNKAVDLGTGVLASILPGGTLAAPGIRAGLNAGVDALKNYVATHKGLTDFEKNEIAKQEAYDREHQSSSEDSPIETPEPSKAIAQVDNTPKSRWSSGWDTKALGNMALNNTSYGWNATNDVMGHSTRALSDAHFKDFCVAMIDDNPALHNVIKTKLMLNYFKG